EIAFLGADAVTEVAALVGGVGVAREFDRVELEAGVVGIGLELDVVEYKDLALWADQDLVADAHRLDHALGLLGDAAGIAIVRLAGCRLEDRAAPHNNVTWV